MNRSLPILLMIASLAVLILNQGRLDRLHREHQLNRMVSAEGVPPTLAVTTFALGPMRSLAADVLWWRAIQQQNEGRFYDAMQLADWITRLQPTYSSVWVFHSWNMGYNISAEFAGEEDSWRWVDRSIRLLRDEGLRYNPDNRHIRHTLARIFYDKIGGSADIHAEYYRTRWAFMMRDYFLLGNRAELTALVSAPASAEAFLSRPGCTAYRDAALRRGIDIFNFTANPPGTFPIADLDMPADQARDAAIELYRYYRRARIVNDLKLDPDRMLFIDREYGPLDWRLHHAHAIYWVAEDKWEDFITGSVNYAHIIRQSMMASFRDGKMLYLEPTNSITYTNNLEIIDRIHDYMEKQLTHNYNPVIDAHHRQFLELAVTVLYSYNRIKAARVVYDHYVEDYFANAKAPSFEEFVSQAMLAAGGSVGGGETRSFIEATLYDSFRWLAYGEQDRSNGSVALARMLYDRHLASGARQTLPPFEHMVTAARTRFAEDNRVDASRLGNLEKSVRTKAGDAPAVDIESFTRGPHQRPPSAPAQ